MWAPPAGRCRGPIAPVEGFTTGAAGGERRFDGNGLVVGWRLSAPCGARCRAPFTQVDAVDTIAAEGQNLFAVHGLVGW